MYVIDMYVYMYNLYILRSYVKAGFKCELHCWCPAFGLCMCVHVCL